MDNHTNGNPDSSGSPDGGEQLAFIRQETRFEIGLLHERVNALVAAEAFLTIAFTAVSSIERLASSKFGFPLVMSIPRTVGLVCVDSLRLKLEFLGVVLNAIEAGT